MMKILSLISQTWTGRSTSGTQVQGQYAEQLLITAAGLHLVVTRVLIFTLLYICVTLICLTLCNVRDNSTTSIHFSY